MKRYFYGTKSLMRLYFRQNRIFTLVWLLLPALWIVINTLSSLVLFPTQEALVEMGVTLIDPITEGMHGPLLDVSIAGFITWRTKVFLLLLCGIFGIIHMIRHTRLAEEQGKQELLCANVIGSCAPLAAAFGTMLLINACAMTLAFLGMIALGLGFVGSLAHCAGVFASAVVLGALAGAVAQFFEGAATARGASFGCLGALFILHILWNVTGYSHPIGYLSPMEWPLLVRPFAGERFEVLLIPLVFYVLLAALSLLLMSRRDLNSGLVPQKKGRAHAKPGFRSLGALAWRTQRRLFIPWLIFYALMSFALGWASYLMASAVSSAAALADLVARLGGVDRAFMSLMLYVLSMLLCIYTLMVAGILRREELAKGEVLLSLPVERSRFVMSHIPYIFGGPAIICLVSAICVGLGGALSTGEDGIFLRYFLEVIVKLPAIWAFGGIAVMLFGLLPRIMSGASYGIWTLFVLIEILWEQQTVSDAMYAISPFSWVNPMRELEPLGLVFLVAVSAVLAAVGTMLFCKRDAALK